MMKLISKMPLGTISKNNTLVTKDSFSFDSIGKIVPVHFGYNYGDMMSVIGQCKITDITPDELIGEINIPDEFFTDEVVAVPLFSCNTELDKNNIELITDAEICSFSIISREKCAIPNTELYEEN